MTAPKALSNTLDLIGNTPLVLLEGPSEAAGCAIWGKCEFLNPFGSVKDRVSQKSLFLAVQYVSVN